MKHTLVFRSAASLLFGTVLLFAGCSRQEEPAEEGGAHQTVITVSLPQQNTKTTMGPSISGVRKLYWSEGDCLSVNGVFSQPLSGIGSEASSALFSFSGNLTTPYKILYPSSFYKDASSITLPASQHFIAGSFASGAYPLAASVADGDAPSIQLHHLCALLKISVKKEPGVSTDPLTRVTFKGNCDEQVCGDFLIDYAAAALTPAAPAGTGRKLVMTMDQGLSDSEALDIYLVVPAGTYPGGFTVVLEDESHNKMTKARSSEITLTAGSIARMAVFSFVPSSGVTEFVLEDIVEELLEPDGYNVKGRVIDNAGHPVEGVVVSDGTKCVRSQFNGEFFLKSNLNTAKYIQISTPSGYLPVVNKGIPQFYKLISSLNKSGGVIQCGDFVLTPIGNPDRFTVFFTADPQPRASSATLDNVAYRSGRACEALYRDLKETAATIQNHQVIGICLGDLVHGSSTTNLNLMGDYASALGTLGYPTFNVIGNHDYDVTKDNDDAGAWKFESYFGPRNYSFNMGGIHFVILDNLILRKEGSSLSAYDQGLTDEIWTWLQADLATVTKETTVMVCAHSPMFKLETGSERTNTAKHGSDYGALFDEFNEVHAWAGHTHSTFNFIYSQSHRHRNVQVHTLARSTGELWTNEYLANGTPRGFTIMEVDKGNISWRFHPTKYLLSNFHGTKGQPAYVYRDWDYTANVAKMRDSGADLDESYQMHVYAPGSYGDNCVYANIFLWDTLWEMPTFTPAGGKPVTMTHVEAYDNSGNANTASYDRADTEFKTFYKNTYGSTLGNDYSASNPGLHTLFKVETSKTVGSGTVSVTDRFGKTYSRSISW